MPNRSKSSNRSRSKSHKRKRRHESSVSSYSDSSDNGESRKSKSSKKVRNESHRRKRRDESSNSSDSGSSDIKEARGSKRSESKFHKRKRRDISSASSDSTCSDNAEITLLLKLEKERKKALEIRKRQKELMKANETPEQKRLRRLRKKQEKEKKVKEKMGWDNDYLHYTNSDNPFGDGDLLSTFLWKKKLNKDGLEGISKEELEMRNKFKQGENKRELEKVKKRRIERDLEKQRKEEETLMAQRTKEATQFEEWQRQEDTFHLEQARLRSHIRIQDGRAKPIDLLAKYISAEEEVDAVEMHEPYTYLNGLLTKDLEDLVEDIKVYKELEKGKNIDYWNDITIIVEDELQKLRKLEHQNEIDVGLNRREGIHQSVASDVTSVFKGKTTGQLATLQHQIEAKISKKTDGLDIGYWESLLSQLKAHMARARLQDRHKESLHRKLQVLKAEQAVATVASTSNLEEDDNDAYSNKSDENEDNFTSPLDECFKAYEAGGYSPRLLTVDDVELGTIVSTEEDDLKRLQFARQQITENNSKHTVSKEEKLFEKEVRKDMGEDEAQFSVEASLENQVYLWSDKYRPRKPRYFNRVHTGFEWNKYNQTHYDMDNPPPKIVQGYKFNIFYPDMIDKNSTPEYFLTTCQDKEFSILRFNAGPPYEDIAFKIVNREWEYSYKRGFRCQFHNNIFQLWFHFKRYRYRR